MKLRMGDNTIKGFDIKKVCVFANCIARALKVIHSLDYVHADLKPENVVLFNYDKKVLVKLIDFSSAFLENITPISYPITTIFYRAPEVCLKLPCSKKIDIWSFGCLLFEMFTGHPLFSSLDESELLVLFEKIIGKIPDNMLNSSSVKDELEKARQREVTTLFNETLEQYILNYYISYAKTEQEKKIDDEFRRRLVDILKKCLTIDPNERIDIEDVIQHPFITAEGISAK
jgi:serine/threonine protein kinase